MKLKEIAVKGFKSISNHDYERIAFNDVTVLWGRMAPGKAT